MSFFACTSRKLLRVGLAGLLATSGVLLGQIPAQAAPTANTAKPTASEIAELRAMFDKFSVPTAKRDALISKVNQGIPWDALVGTKASTHETRTIDNYDYSIDRFPDGSVKAVGLEKAVVVGDFSTQTLQGCRVRSGSGYKDYQGCQIDGVWGSVHLTVSDLAYTIVQGSNDSIYDWGYGSQKCIGVTCSSPVRVLSRAQENTNGVAYGRYQSDVASPGGSWNVWLQLNVGKDKAWQTNS